MMIASERVGRKHRTVGVQVVESIGSRAESHCAVAQSIKVGEKGSTNDGHVVERISGHEWMVVSVPSGCSGFSEGQWIPGRVVFWKMNGLNRKITAS